MSDSTGLLALNTYRITWANDLDGVEDIEAYAVTIDGSGEAARVTFIGGGVILSALSSEISVVRLVPNGAAYDADSADSAANEQSEEAPR